MECTILLSCDFQLAPSSKDSTCRKEIKKYTHVHLEELNSSIGNEQVRVALSRPLFYRGTLLSLLMSKESEGVRLQGYVNIQFPNALHPMVLASIDDHFLNQLLLLDL